MQRAAIGTIIPNLTNPRIIKDVKFKKLVKSIQEFPQMLELRPIIVDSNMVVLGGNMRLKACIAAGLKEVPIIVADQLTDEQKAEFIIKDNVGFGEWDWDMLANQWDNVKLEDWGMDVWLQGTDINELVEDDLNLTEVFDPIGGSAGMQRVVFLFDGMEEAESYLNSQKIKYKKMNMAWQVNMTSKELI